MAIGLYLAGVIRTVKIKRTPECWLTSDMLGIVLSLDLGQEEGSAGGYGVNNASWTTWKFRWS